MKTAILVIFVTANIWLTAAKPYPLQVDTSTLNQNVVIELLRKLAEETDGTKVGLEQIGNDQPDIEEPGNEEPLIEKPGIEILEDELEVQNQGATHEDEEKINEKTGISKNPNVFGDLVLTPDQIKSLEGGEGRAQGFRYTARRWTYGVIPYEFDRNLNYKARRAIQQAMTEFTQRSCIRFVQRNIYNYRRYANYVQFIPDNGCYSYLGMFGGRQPISIGARCEYKGIVQHEILHALGRVHEQSRPDRDQYVYINLNNVQSKYRHNFNKFSANTQNLPYDYGSIMHYGARAFSMNGQPTIIPRRRNASIGQRDGLSAIDWTHLKKAYCSSSEIQSLGEGDDDDGTDYQLLINQLLANMEEN